MKYTREERLDIGRRIYDGEISRFQAAELYDISPNTAREYMRLYRDAHHLPPKQKSRSGRSTSPHTQASLSSPVDLETYESMSKEELVHELVKARIAEARLKKGYEVKGDGSIIHYSSKNTR